MTAGAPVVDLAEYVKALRERDTVVRLLAPYGWFIEARLEVKPTGQVVILALTTPPSDATERSGVLARVASHLGGVQLEVLPRPVAKVRAPSQALGPEQTVCKEGETE